MTSRTSTPVSAGRSSRPRRWRRSRDLLPGQQHEDVLEVRRAALALGRVAVGVAGSQTRRAGAARAAGRRRCALALDLGQLAPAARRPRPPRRPRARRPASRGGPVATALPCDMIVTRVGEALGLLDVVRRHQDRGALAAQRVDQRPQLLADLRVQADGRLVEQHQPRAVHERRGRSAAAGACRRRACRPSCRGGRRGWRSPARARPRRLRSRARHAVEVARRRAGSARRSASRRGCRAAARRRTRRAPPSTRPAAGRPSTSISPSSAIACAVSSRIVVDLPAPLGPSRPTHVPSGTSRSRPSTAVIAPKRLTTPRRRMARARHAPGCHAASAQFGTGSRAVTRRLEQRAGAPSTASRRATGRRATKPAPSIASTVPSAARADDRAGRRRAGRRPGGGRSSRRACAVRDQRGAGASRRCDLDLVRGLGRRRRSGGGRRRAGAACRRRRR